ncbi:YdeI/OmpD-associated family protein [Tenacibaculum agarivorans]|uniref:YdeI/OmpD-associated family protein n=1 Tax=Tenacibaculum agarivorans TaxID=1908389 RepID=UPI00094BB7A0|nr:YdeI/OmpD-associated family protein [Tenacibaculum agarivorans]
MEKTRLELYFEKDVEWYNWLALNHDKYDGIYLIFYKVETKIPSMRWEEAVKVALCFGWIDSTVKSLGNGKRRQYFSPRKPKSVWSRLNKTYIEELSKKGLLQKSGLKSIEIAKQNGSWTSLDSVEDLIIPDDLKLAFHANPIAYKNYENFSPSYRKNYLYWLFQAKREATRHKRIQEIIKLCEANKKQR